jgi:hypothetical protein
MVGNAILRGQRVGLGTVVALVLIVGFVTWFALELGGSSAPTPTTTALPAAQARGPLAVTPAQLGALTSSLGHAVYWAGPQANTTYELTISSDGHTDVRYLPKGVQAGTTGGYLTVATYPIADAYATTSAISGDNISTVTLPNNGIAKYQTSNDSDIHLAYQGVNAQVEVFDPTPGAARTLVAGGAIVAVP